MAKRKRRAFTPEFKEQAVRIVRESGKPIATVARELDLTETALRSWVRQAEIDAGPRQGRQDEGHPAAHGGPAVPRRLLPSRAREAVREDLTGHAAVLVGVGSTRRRRDARADDGQEH